MTVRYYANAPATTLAAPASNSDTSIQVTSVSGFPVSYPYTLILDKGEATEELVDVTAGAGTTLTVTRAVDSTTAFAHTSGSAVVHGLCARDLREANQHINATTGVHGLAGSPVGTTDVQTLTHKDLTDATNTFPSSLATDAEVTSAVSAGVSTHAALTSTHGVTGSIVGTGGVQTLTGKTLSILGNTISGFGPSIVPVTDASGNLVNSGKAFPTGSFVGTTDSQTLTSKTLTSPTINGGTVDAADVTGSDLSATDNVMPVSVRCQVSRSTTQAVTATPTGVTWGTTDYNNGGYVVAGTTVTVPHDGVYALSGITGFDGVGGGDRIGIQLCVNGLVVAVDAKDLSTSSDAETTCSCSSTFQLSAGATVSLLVETTGTGGTTTASTTSTSRIPTLTVVWLGS